MRQPEAGRLCCLYWQVRCNFHTATLLPSRPRCSSRAAPDLTSTRSRPTSSIPQGRRSPQGRPDRGGIATRRRCSETVRSCHNGHECHWKHIHSNLNRRSLRSVGTGSGYHGYSEPARFGHEATLLSDGQVPCCGWLGRDRHFISSLLTSAEIYSCTAYAVVVRMSHGG